MTDAVEVGGKAASLGDLPAADVEWAIDADGLPGILFERPAEASSRSIARAASDGLTMRSGRVTVDVWATWAQRVRRRVPSTMHP
jgi:hypothetical protein